MTTKLYRNDSTETLNVLGVGEIPVGEQVSITAEFQPPVLLGNYPGLVDVLAEEAATPSPSTPEEQALVPPAPVSDAPAPAEVPSE